MTELAAPSATVTSPMARRLLLTLLLLLAARIPAAIPLPGVDPSQLRLDHIPPAAMLRFSLGALGLQPYIEAWIMVHVIQAFMPFGAFGSVRLERAVRGVAVGFALMRGFLVGTALGYLPVVGDDVVALPLTTALALAAAQLFLIWLGDLVTRYGIGPGMPLIIVTPLLATLADNASRSYEMMRLGLTTPGESLVLLIAILSTLLAIVFVARARYRLPVADGKDEGTRFLSLTLVPAGIVASLCVAAVPAGLGDVRLLISQFVDPSLADIPLGGTLLTLLIGPPIFLAAMILFGPAMRHGDGGRSAGGNIRHLTLILGTAGGALLALFVVLPDFVAWALGTHSPITGSQLMLLTFVALACLRPAAAEER